jgi:hypothetical protein
LVAEFVDVRLVLAAANTQNVITHSSVWTSIFAIIFVNALAGWGSYFILSITPVEDEWDAVC